MVTKKPTKIVPDTTHNMVSGKLAKIASETVSFVISGRYKTCDGTTVNMSDAVESSRRRTYSVPPTQNIGTQIVPSTVPNATTLRVLNTTTLKAAQDLHSKGLNPVSLNFASAKRPGGGFMSGAQAQEEYLCRLSSLYYCLQGQPMYEWHHKNPGTLYSSWVVYSPDVVVFRDDNHGLLAEPWATHIITSPAPNIGSQKLVDKIDQKEIKNVLTERAGRILSVAHKEGHDSLVLGAWGCGVFGCDPKMVATVFHGLLTGPYNGVFREVVFAVLDHNPGQPNFTAFAKIMGS